MNGSTKILTVSYGTFSCTLEGFDDPLGSMREIAEYFRDLTADDRYFGAEPPTPDVELLQDMAEKETRRRVDARVTDTGIALVAASAASEAATSEPTNTPPADTGGQGPLAFDDDYLMSDEPEDVLAVDPDVSVSVDGPAESVAEKLRRIRAVVSKSIEEDDGGSFSETLAPDAANATEYNERALSETIRAIQDDLADDEDVAHDGDVIAEDGIEVIEGVEISSGEAADEIDAEADTLRAISERLAEVNDDDGSDTEDDQSISDVIESISDRLDDDAEDEDENDLSPAALAPKPEDNVGRLVSETNNKLSEDSSVRRREVISQMRAAVAATKADRLVSGQVSRQEQEEEEKSEYREVLSEAVKDRPLSERQTPATNSPPLVLVSSQRTDIGDADADGDDEGDAPAGKGSSDAFAAYAQQVGARELPDLLEAAAAYAVFEQGKPSFTRPEIMERVARIDPTVELSREESLRTFGQLLRLGKFVKLERGQFTIDKGSQYRSEQVSNSD